jgi:hypothetical protein
LRRGTPGRSKSVCHGCFRRAAAELIKCEGFRFLQLTGTYSRTGKKHTDLFALFAENVEAIIQTEIKEYIIAAKPTEHFKQ